MTPANQSAARSVPDSSAMYRVTCLSGISALAEKTTSYRLTTPGPAPQPGRGPLLSRESLALQPCGPGSPRAICVHARPRLNAGINNAIMKRPGDPRVNIQSTKGMAKAFQVRQVIRAIEKLEGLK